MTRLYGRAASNERVVDHTPDTRFERTTILSSIRANGDMVPLVFEGSLIPVVVLVSAQERAVPIILTMAAILGTMIGIAGHFLNKEG